MLHAGAGREGKVMMTRTLVSGMLAVVALVALSATGAQAGSGGSPSPLTSFFVCNSVHGDDAGNRVDVVSSFWNFNPVNVRIGNTTLACAFAKLFPGGSSPVACDNGKVPPDCNEITPNPQSTYQQLKCYSISVPRQTGNSPPPSYTVTDQLLGTDPNVTGSSLQYICAPARFKQNAQ
jgi:hypothetical protein